MAMMLFILAGFTFLGGVLIFRFAKKGEQNTLGGIVMLIALVIAALAALCQVAGARDLDGRYANSPLRQWFDSLSSKRGLCCSDADGRAVKDVDWESRNGGYRVFFDGEWHDVPPDAVVTVPNRAGRTMVWPIRGPYGWNIICFMPGPGA